MVKFMLCKKEASFKDDFEWISETESVTASEGFDVPFVLLPDEKSDTIGLYYETDEEKFASFITKHNLTVDQIVDEIRFLKSS